MASKPIEKAKLLHFCEVLRWAFARAVFFKQAWPLQRITLNEQLSTKYG
jgi:hypothetical protein